MDDRLRSGSGGGTGGRGGETRRRGSSCEYFDSSVSSRDPPFFALHFFVDFFTAFSGLILPSFSLSLSLSLSLFP